MVRLKNLSSVATFVTGASTFKPDDVVDTDAVLLLSIAIETTFDFYLSDTEIPFPAITLSTLLPTSVFKSENPFTATFFPLKATEPSVVPVVRVSAGVLI
nr:MAG TPA: hypothetical protein [Bacteriophage sp.]